MNDEHEHLRELIEACRPGHDDLASPEFGLLAERLDGDERLREQFELSQQVDQAITTAFHDVAIPRGLADRLLDGLTDLGADEAPKAKSTPVVIRRRWLPWMASTVGISCVAAAIYFFLLGVHPDLWTPTQFAQNASKWTQPDGISADAWRNLNSDSSVRAQFPPRLPSKAELVPHTWQRAGGSTAVCYRLRTADNGEPAYLIVLPGRGSKGFLAAPELIIRTGGRCVAVWAGKNHLYALVIEGTENRYWRLVPSSPTA